MRAFRLVGPGRLALVDMEPPVATSGEVIVRVLACGLCGTDVHIKQSGHYGWDGAAITLGHEILGEADGRRVVVEPQLFCRSCRFCLSGRPNVCENLKHLGIGCDGGFQERLAVPKANLHDAPEVENWQAALVEPVAGCVAALKLAKIEDGMTLGIVGLGFFGQTIAQIARMRGASKIIGVDPSERRRRLAEECGAISRSYAPEDAIDRLADVAIDAAGSTTAPATALKLAEKAGTIVVFGYDRQPTTLNWYDILSKELTVVGCKSSAHAWPEALRLTPNLDLAPLVKTYPFERAEEAFADMERGDVLKPVLMFDG